MEKIELDFSDIPKEPSLIEKRFFKAKRYLWKYQKMEKTAQRNRMKWQKRVSYYEKKINQL